MLMDSKVTIAYKCAICGTFKFFSVYLFDLLNKKEFHLICNCKKSEVIFSDSNLNTLKIKVPCIACDEPHIHSINRKKIIDRKILVLNCINTSIPQAVIGEDSEVRSKIDSHERELDDLINMFGYDNYFINTQVMFDSLNRIHDIAEKGKIICECGSNEIDVVLLPDKILLNCKECPGVKIINASTNEDLKTIQKIKGIILGIIKTQDLDKEMLDLIGVPLNKT